MIYGHLARVKTARNAWINRCNVNNGYEWPWPNSPWPCNKGQSREWSVVRLLMLWFQHMFWCWLLPLLAASATITFNEGSVKLRGAWWHSRAVLVSIDALPASHTLGHVTSGQVMQLRGTWKHFLHSSEVCNRTVGHSTYRPGFEGTQPWLWLLLPLFQHHSFCILTRDRTI